MTTATASKNIIYESNQTVSGSPMRRLADGKIVDKPARCLIPNRDRAIINGKLTDISYIKGADTHITSEQREQQLIQKDEKGQEMFPDFIEVLNGFVMMDEEDKCGQLYLAATNFNGSNPSRRKNSDILFYARDREKEAAEALTLRKLKLSAEHAVMFELNEQDIRNLAGTVKDRKGFSLNPNSPVDELRNQLADIAKFNPDAILNGVQNNDAESKKLVLDALELNILKIAQGGIIQWGDGKKKGKRICTMRVGMTQAKRVRVVNDYFTSHEGESDLILLKELMENKLQEETV